MIDIQQLQNMDPVVFEQMQPLVQQAVSSYGARRNITEADIDEMADEIVLNSRSQFRSPVEYNQDTLRDIARFLLLISLYNTYGYNLDPFWLLYFGGVPNFLIPYLIVGLPPFYRIPWRPPYTGPYFRPPGGRPRPPYGGRPPRPPFGGGPSRPPFGGGPPRPPFGGGPSRPPSGGGPSRPPSGGGSSRPPSGSGPSRPPSGGGPARPPSGGGPSRPPSGGGPARPRRR